MNSFSNTLIIRILQYFDRLKINIDKSKFSYELELHPKFPQLISVVDTLELFEIDFGIYEASFDETSSEHNIFMALMDNGSGDNALYLLEKDKRGFKIDKEIIPISDINKRWSNVVLILEKNHSKRKYFYSKLEYKVFGFIFLIIWFLWLFSNNFIILVICLLSLVGFYFSIISFKELFEISQIPLIDKVCVKSDCDSVINSKKWGEKQFLNFSNLSITFFFSQLFLLVVLAILGESNFFLSFLRIALYFSIPLILISLYYQGSVLKKWCQICLTIISILIFEIIILNSFDKENSFRLDLRLTLLILIIYFFIFYFWISFKENLVELKNVKKNNLLCSRKMNKYNIFKTLLEENKTYNINKEILPESKHNNKLSIILVTDPYCDFCKEVHDKIKLILQDFHENIIFNVIFNIDIREETIKDKMLYRNIMNIQFNENFNRLNEALNYWYKSQNRDKWLSKYSNLLNEKEIDQILDNQKEWCNFNNINYTPALLINDFLFPNIYKIENLRFFIEDLILDSEKKS